MGGALSSNQKATVRYPNGTYEGQIISRQHGPSGQRRIRHGYGSLTYKDEDAKRLGNTIEYGDEDHCFTKKMEKLQKSNRYHGEWYLGKRHGAGLFFTKNGEATGGQWLMERGQHGRGVMIRNNLHHYDGNFCEGRWCGLGRLISPGASSSSSPSKSKSKNANRMRSEKVVFGQFDGGCEQEGILICSDGVFIWRRTANSILAEPWSPKFLSSGKANVTSNVEASNDEDEAQNVETSNAIVYEEHESLLLEHQNDYVDEYDIDWPAQVTHQNANMLAAHIVHKVVAKRLRIHIDAKLIVYEIVGNALAQYADIAKSDGVARGYQLDNCVQENFSRGLSLGDGLAAKLARADRVLGSIQPTEDTIQSKVEDLHVDTAAVEKEQQKEKIPLFASTSECTNWFCERLSVADVNFILMSCGIESPQVDNLDGSQLLIEVNRQHELCRSTTCSVLEGLSSFEKEFLKMLLAALAKQFSKAVVPISSWVHVFGACDLNEMDSNEECVELHRSFGNHQDFLGDYIFDESLLSSPKCTTADQAQEKESTDQPAVEEKFERNFRVR